MRARLPTIAHRSAAFRFPALLVGLWLSGCAALDVRSPEVALVGIDLERVSLFESTLVVALRVDNPNAFRLPLERGVYTFFLDGDRIGTGATRDAVDVPARSSRTQQVEIRLDNQRLLSRLGSLFEREVAYRIDAEHYLRGFGDRALRSSSAGEVDLSTALRRSARSADDAMR
jgi:LEA14-like dessication related protein